MQELALQARRKAVHTITKVRRRKEQDTMISTRVRLECKAFLLPLRAEKRIPAMALTDEEQQLRARFFKVILEAT
jgi:hypothetical protein